MRKTRHLKSVDLRCRQHNLYSKDSLQSSHKGNHTHKPLLYARSLLLLSRPYVPPNFSCSIVMVPHKLAINESNLNAILLDAYAQVHYSPHKSALKQVLDMLKDQSILMNNISGILQPRRQVHQTTTK